MLSSIVVTLLAAAPSAGCAHCDLRADAAAPLDRTATHRLLAQADLPPPPLPGADVQTGTPPVVSPGTPEQLQVQIDDLNRQIRGIDVNWPSHLILIAYAGYLLAPTGILLGGMTVLIGIASLIAAGPGGAIIIAVGAGVLALGIAGVVAIIYAWTAGNAQQAEAKRRRGELIHQRDELEAQLKQMRSHVELGAPEPQLITLVTF